MNEVTEMMVALLPLIVLAQIFFMVRKAFRGMNLSDKKKIKKKKIKAEQTTLLDHVENSDDRLSKMYNIKD